MAYILVQFEMRGRAEQAASVSGQTYQNSDSLGTALLKV